MKDRSFTYKQILVVVLLLLAVPTAVLWGWNLVLPSIFGVGALKFSQALGLVILGFVASRLFQPRRRGHHTWDIARSRRENRS